MRIILSAAAIAMALPVAAQQTSGVITYQETISIDIKAEGISGGLASLMPTEQKNTKVLYFTPDASLYKSGEEKSADKEKYEQNNSNIKVTVSAGHPEDAVYTDLKAKKTIRQEDFMGRTFLVDGVVHDIKWKFTGRQKMIIGLPCMEAFTVIKSGILGTDTSDKEDTVSVWFTSSIPVNSGPKYFSGLPGMILEMTSGPEHTEATGIAPADKKSLAKIKAPSKGKKVSEEEFNKIVGEKMEEMKKQYGQGGNGVFIIQSGGR